MLLERHIKIDKANIRFLLQIVKESLIFKTSLTILFTYRLIDLYL